ncbi:MAG: hypothetical protein IMX04_05495 [Candidatus Carbobacillus altaicus]|uniref:Post-transcriptional regulator n=1 Tax=Candidatus Carbonibacillus altaicus TaxID=2163959 RepID=A0A2R6Y5B7_9BACL|nr:hypothetical protein [Candidatus Carbobacillus altaicus]PTQ57854.1 MAG: hypothetical protein BSOLF_0716 [Candidatus Carbobacillus altaicus]
MDKATDGENMITLSSFSEETLSSLKALCKKKAEEFNMLGYDVSSEAVWAYVEHRFKSTAKLYEVVEVILHLRIQTWMNYATREAFLSSESSESLF